jgi:hypothetical protein
MADLTNGSGVFQTYNNAGTGVAELGDNKVNAGGTASNGVGPRTVVVELNNGGNVSQAELDGFIDGITTASAAGAGVSAADAFTIVAIENVDADDASGPIHAILQGTGTVGTDAGDYVSGLTVTVVADFGAPGA